MAICVLTNVKTDKIEIMQFTKNNIIQHQLSNLELIIQYKF